MKCTKANSRSRCRFYCLLSFERAHLRVCVCELVCPFDEIFMTLWHNFSFKLLFKSAAAVVAALLVTNAANPTRDAKRENRWQTINEEKRKRRTTTAKNDFVIDAWWHVYVAFAYFHRSTIFHFTLFGMRFAWMHFAIDFSLLFFCLFVAVVFFRLVIYRLLNDKVATNGVQWLVLIMQTHFLFVSFRSFLLFYVSLVRHVGCVQCER